MAEVTTTTTTTTTTIKFTRKSYFEATVPYLLPIMTQSGNQLTVQPPPTTPEVVTPAPAPEADPIEANETPAPAAPAVGLRNVTRRTKPSVAVRPGATDQTVPDGAMTSTRSSTSRATKTSVGTRRATAESSFRQEPLNHSIWKY